MCGIAGKLHLDGHTPVDKALLDRMSNVIQYRGPDGCGKYLSGPVGLAHRRLSIIDVSDAGAQPMCNEDGTVWITFNGEIYNYQELRRQLIARGHIFKGQSDTEVIVHLYEEYGVECPTMLKGMFAFAIWDVRQRSLFLARDRVGIKPLYYVETQTALIFGSEIKVLLQDPSVGTRINAKAVDAFLTHLYSPTEETIFAGVHKLPPGHTLLVRGGRLSLARYWDLEFSRTTPHQSLDEAAESLSSLLQTTVREHMISDVPVGFLASGGIDSTALLSYAVGQTTQPIQTFTVGFGGSGVADERPYAKLVADRFGTIHRDITVSADEFRDLLPSYVWHMEEPVCEPPSIALYCISRLARAHVKVLMSGEGGDEAFAGYPEYSNFLLLERLKANAGPAVSRMAVPLVRALSSLRRFRKFRRYAGMLQTPLQSYYISRTATPFNRLNPIKSQIYTADFSNAAAQRPLWAMNGATPSLSRFEAVSGKSLLSQMLYVDTKTWLPDDLLIKADRMTMANSIELRVPFLDHHVLEFAASLPDEYKVDKRTTKVALRKAFASRIPPEVLNRKKAGFPVPFERWIDHDLRDYVADTVLSRKAIDRGYFRKPALEKLIFSKDADRASEKFSLLTLELWHQRFVDLVS